MMRNLMFYIIVGLISNFVNAKDDLRRTWTLYHSMDPKLGDKGFTKRSVVTLEPENSEAKLTLENDESSFSAENLEAMMSSGWYQLKLVENGKASTVPVKTTIPACHLRRANFRYVNFYFSELTFEKNFPHSSLVHSSFVVMKSRFLLDSKDM